MKQVLVIGAARSGISVAKLLNQHNYRVTITDQNRISDSEKLIAQGIEVIDGGHPESLLLVDWDFIVKNPGIPYRVPFVKSLCDRGFQIFTEIEVAYRYAKNYEYGAITGTNGKTTITTMLYEMLKTSFDAKFAGNIGVPLSELVLENPTAKYKVALELSNFQLLGMESFRPSVSTICNLAPDHLDYMDSLESYYKSKTKIYENCKDTDVFLRNVDDILVMEYVNEVPCELVDVSMKREDVDVRIVDGIIKYKEVELFKENDLQLIGDYNMMNAMLAASMAYVLGVNPKYIRTSIQSFRPVAHRLEFVGEFNGVKVYNDSKATNPHATAAALQSFDNILLLAGGHEKGLSFNDLKKYDNKVKCCIAYGETKVNLASIFTHSETKETMFEAFDRAVELCETGDVILLSPACSSYDQFVNYEVRGEQFKEYVHSYITKEGK